MNKQPLVLLSGCWNVEDCLVQLLFMYTLAAYMYMYVYMYMYLCKTAQILQKMGVTSKF
jgi:hypothetical protein